MGIAGGGSSDSYSTTTALDRGGSLGTGILNSIFGQDQQLARGQYVAGTRGQLLAGGPSADASKSEIVDYLLEQRGVGSNRDAGDLDDLAWAMGNVKNYRTKTRANLGSVVGSELGSEFFGMLGLMDPNNADTKRIMGFADDVLGRQSEIFGDSSDMLGDFIRTGRPVDTSALVNRGITDLKEQFSGMGNLYGSDVRAEGLRLGSRLGVDAEERARARQMAAIGMGRGFGSSQLDFLNKYEQGTAAGRKFNTFNRLFGQQGTTPTSLGTDSSSETHSTTDANYTGLIPSVSVGI